MTTARVSAARRMAAGQAHTFIKPLAINRGDPVVLCVRVSRCQQHHRGNLDAQAAHLWAEVEARGGVVVGEHRHVGSGFDPYWLMAAARRARDAGAVLVARTVSRFIRGWRYHSADRPNARPRTAELDELRDATLGVPLMTLLPPTATPAEERAFETRHGHAPPGRPRRAAVEDAPPVRSRTQGKVRREALLPAVLDMHARGMSTRQIAAALAALNSGHQPPYPKTVLNWIRAAERERNRAPRPTD